MRPKFSSIRPVLSAAGILAVALAAPATAAAAATFAAPTAITLSDPRAVDLGFVDAGTTPDLVYVDQTANLLRVRTAGVTVNTETTYDIATGMHSIKLSDIDSDGDQDLVLLSNPTAQVWLNNGSGSFTLADSASIPGDWGISIDVADLTRDGIPDLLIGRYTGPPAVIPGEGGGMLGAVIEPTGTGTVSEAIAADVDGDGHPDLVYTDFCAAGELHVLRNLGAGSFAAEQTYAVTTCAATPRATDWNGDGHIDLLAVSRDGGHARLFTNDGDGTFTLGDTAALADTPYAGDMGDVTGDERPDFVVARTSASPTLAAVFANPGTGSSLTADPAGVPMGSDDVFRTRIVDTDGDLRPDLLGLDAAGDTLYVMSNTTPFPPRNTAVPTLTGTATVGSTLTCNPGSWIDSTSVSYQWLRGASVIAGATSATYVLQASDGGASVSCRETATNATGSRSATSAARAVPTPTTVTPTPDPDPDPDPDPETEQDLCRNFFGTQTERPKGTVINRRDLCVGTSRANRIFGTNGRDVLLGYSGRDRLYGRDGDDVLNGGFGSDRLAGGDGADHLLGGTGNDLILAIDGSASDVIVCGPGRDLVRADIGDTVHRSCEQVVRVRLRR